MKSFLIMGLGILLISCGKSAMDAPAGSSANSPLVSSNACANSIVSGRWISATGTGVGVSFTEDCRYINEFCKSTGSYPANVLSEKGNVLITVDSRASGAPAQCLPLGTFECQYVINKAASPNQLTVVCGNVYGIYNKQ